MLYDFAKAFDTISHSGILRILNKLRCPVTIGNWITSYLKERCFKICDGNNTSSERNIKSGVPQGGCLSALLFALFINDLGKKLKKLSPKLNFALFADDVSVWCSHSRISSINKTLQKATNIIKRFADNKGLRLNVDKCSYLVIARNFNRPSYLFSSNLHLTINNSQIKKTEYPTLLGITLDSGLTFKEHFKNIKIKCESKINLLKILSSKIYCINPKYLLTIYKALVLSLIQYSMLPYAITSNKIKKDLQVIQNRAIRVIFKLNKRTSKKILQSVSNIEPLENRLKKLMINFINKSALHSNEIKSIIEAFDSNENNKKSILSYISNN